MASPKRRVPPTTLGELDRVILERAGAVVGVDDQLKGQLPIGLVVLKDGVDIAVADPTVCMKRRRDVSLPPKIARDLMEGRREGFSPEYRRAIETYFRLVAEESIKEDTP